MKRFILRRDVDVSGISGTGDVAEGIVFTDGTVAIRWRGESPSTVLWTDIDAPVKIHGHGGHTRFVWLDE